MSPDANGEEGRCGEPTYPGLCGNPMPCAECATVRAARQAWDAATEARTMAQRAEEEARLAYRQAKYGGSGDGAT